CASRSPVPAACPSCGSAYLRQFGAGTQRVVAELEALMPGMPIVRMDADTTTGKGGHERQLAQFESLSLGVLVGTQMVAKGLDYPEVTLVGVLNADTTLHLPDFRASERTWQLLTQVAGRAGRGPLGGSVVIQTYWPDHPAVRAAASGQREALLAEEYGARSILGYPPFGRLANIVISAPNEADAQKAAAAVATALESHMPSEGRLLGPSPAPLAKLKRSYRWHVLLKAPAGAVLSESVRSALSTIRKVEGTTIAVDIDPVDLL
ncbi:MAG: primosomal protein N', partial [Coriobacteriia bacterium]|nr:primosomal protein N' [Coriobacteriia bacterium]